MEELLQTADFVSLNLPYTAAVHHLISARELEMMKRTAYLINTARGAHVDEAALVEALRKGEIAGAAIDVFEHDGMKHVNKVVEDDRPEYEDAMNAELQAEGENVEV